MARMKKTMNPVVGARRIVYRQVMTITEPSGHAYETEPVDYPSLDHAAQARTDRMWLLPRGTTVAGKIVKITTMTIDVEHLAPDPESLAR